MESIFYKQLQKCATAFKRGTGPYLFFLTFFISQAQSVCSQNISFKRIAPPKIESFQGLITGITQDTFGYMWFTSGHVLYRYNGYEFTTYMNDPADPKSLAGERLMEVFADKSGFIWVSDFEYSGGFLLAALKCVKKSARYV